MSEDPRRKREHTESAELTKGDPRSPFQHDRDRILYSHEFRRLSGITQVISPLGHYATHNRLTHSLEVAQIGRSVAALIRNDTTDAGLIDAAGGLDLDVVEAASLAHDLGHPPFGHVTEETLNKKLRSKGVPGFEGNAQSFRIVASLSVHDSIYLGLDLTRATLSALLKYPWKQGLSKQTSSKWGVYEEEDESFLFARQHIPENWRFHDDSPNRKVKTLEAEIMDWADDVAYAIHDLEDFYKTGLIPLPLLRYSGGERNAFLDYRIKTDSFAAQHTGLLEEVADKLLSKNSPFVKPYDRTTSSHMLLKRFSSGKIGAFISEPRLVKSEGNRGWDLQISDESRLEISILKGLLWFYVIDSPAMVSTRLGYANMIGDLFELLAEELEDGRKKEDERHVMFGSFAEQVSRLGVDSNSPSKWRTVADFITSMTESQVVDFYRRIRGLSIGDPLDMIVY